MVHHFTLIRRESMGRRYLGLDKPIRLEPGESDAIVATVRDVSDIQDFIP